MILDIIIIGIILLCVIMGYKKGLIEVAFKLISFIVALVLSLTLYIPVSNAIIQNTQIDENIKNTITQNINPEKIIENKTEETQNQDMPAIVTEYISKTIEETTNTAKENITEIIATNLSVTAIKIITLIILFIIIRILLTLVKFITNMLANLPIIHSANKIRWNNIWNIRIITNNIFSISNSNGNINNNRKYRDINIHK